jgi:integrase
MIAEPLTMRPAGIARRSLARKVNFTARTLAAFTLPQNRNEAVWYDVKVPGLSWRLRRSDAGAPVSAGFFFLKRIDGRKTCVKIGGRELPVDQARRLALSMAGDAAEGITPTERRRTDAASTVTLGQLLDNFIEHHAKPHKKTWQGDQDQIDRYLESWKARRLVDIRQDDIRALHASIGEDHGRTAANRLLALLSSAYSKAGDLWTEGNPCRGVQRFKESSRDRFLTADELPKFFKALDAETDDEGIASAIRFALLSGARRSNVLAARWADIDLAGRTWRIPAEASKSGKVILIPLSPPAIELLQARHKVTGDGDFVFRSYGATGHLLDFRQAWKRVLATAGIKNFRFHDLRRSLGSWMAMSGASLPVVGAALGHKSTASTAVYARLALDPIRAGIDTATAAIMAASKVKARKSKTRKAR